ncbi:MAG: MFS transporter [Burkholderiaceae bacterium]
MRGASAGLAHDRRLVLWLSLAQLISWGSLFYTFTLLMEPVQRELHLGRAEVSLAFSLALLAEGLCAYPVGRWIDRGHERIVMTGGSVLAGAGLLLHSGVHTLAGFYAVWTLLGVAMAATLYAPVFALVTRRFPQDFRRAIITMTFLGGLASTVFIPLSAWLIAMFGWRQTLWWLAGLQFLCCVPIHARLLKRAPRPVRADTTAQGRGTVSMRPYLSSAPFLLLAVFVVLMMAVTAALPAHMVSLLREQGLSEAWVIAVPASMGVIQVVGRALLFFFERHFDLHLANRVIPCLLPAGLAALLLAPWFQRLGGSAWGLAFVLLFVLLYGMGNGMLTIVKGTAIAQYVNREHVASLNGALGIPLALARAAAPLTLGLLWTRQAGYAYGLWLMLGLSGVAITALLMAQRRALRAQADTASLPT